MSLVENKSVTKSTFFKFLNEKAKSSKLNKNELTFVWHILKGIAAFNHQGTE